MHHRVLGNIGSVQSYICLPGMQINGDQQPSLAQRFGIVGYPSICHLRQGQTREYQGDRSLQDVSNPVASYARRHHDALIDDCIMLTLA